MINNYFILWKFEVYLNASIKLITKLVLNFQDFLISLIFLSSFLEKIINKKMVENINYLNTAQKLSNIFKSCTICPYYCNIVTKHFMNLYVENWNIYYYIDPVLLKMCWHLTTLTIIFGKRYFHWKNTM